VIALHLVFGGYGHWLPNDPRGSGSKIIRNELLESLGEIHRGRKRIQPTRSELRSFYREAVPLLEHDPIWFDDARRTIIAEGFRLAIQSRGYTCWACAVLRNHAHACIRRHRDNDTVIWGELAKSSLGLLRKFPDLPKGHRIWADRPFAVFLETPEDIRRVIKYIEGNPEKEGLPPQVWDFVKPYDGWPFHKKAVKTPT
jgi:hypothetical protein